MSVVNNEKIFVEVGSTCLQDFLGTDKVSSIVFSAQFVETIGNIFSEGRGFGKVKPVWGLEEVIATAIQSISQHGYISKAKANELELCSTAGEVLYMLDGDVCYGIAPYTPTNEEIEEAKAIIEYCKTITTENDYKYNLKQIANTESTCITYKAIGYAVSMVPFYRKAMELITPKTKKVSNHVGVIGNRETHKLTFVNSYAFNGFYGTTFFNKFEDINGNIFMWKTGTCPFEEGKTYEVTAMIKSHDEYKGIKQTVINRPKLK